MNQVKWVDGWYDTPEDVPKQQVGKDLDVVPVAVVPLSALTEVVEGLRRNAENGLGAEASFGYLAALHDLLEQVGAIEKEAE